MCTPESEHPTPATAQTRGISLARRQALLLCERMLSLACMWKPACVCASGMCVGKAGESGGSAHWNGQGSQEDSKGLAGDREAVKSGGKCSKVRGSGEAQAE